MKKREIFANLVLSTGLIYCIMMLIYSLLLSNTLPSVRIIYEIVVVVGICFFALLLRCHPKTKVNFSLFVLSTVFSLLLLEILLLFEAVNQSNQKRIHNERARVAQQSGHSFDKRSLYEAITDLRTGGVDAFPIFEPSEFSASNGLSIGQERLYPLAGISNKSVVLCNEMGEWIVIENDDHGFNNPKDPVYSSTVDIILIGDSFTHGMCVEQGKDIGSLLRQAGRTVLNLGISGIGPLEELAILKEYAEPYKPTIVLWLYYEANDLAGLRSEAKSNLLLQYLDQEFSQDLRRHQTIVDRLLLDYLVAEEAQYIASSTRKTNPLSIIWTNRQPILKLYHSRQKLLELVYGVELARISDCKPQLPLFSQILFEADARVRSWGGQLYFIYLPDWVRTNGRLERTDLYCRSDVLQLVDELRIPLIDFNDILSAHHDPLSLFPFRMNGHYTAEAYQLLAQQVENYLKSPSPKLKP